MTADGPAPTGLDDRREWASRVLDLVQRLPATERAVVSLGYFQQRTHAQIARELGLSQRAVGHAMAAALGVIGRAQSA